MAIEGIRITPRDATAAIHLGLCIEPPKLSNRIRNNSPYGDGRDLFMPLILEYYVQM
jgi:hypothetical protein